MTLCAGYANDASNFHFVINCRFYQLQVNIECVFIYVDKHRNCANIGDGFGGGDKGKRRGDYLVAFANAGSSQRQVQGIRT